MHANRSSPAADQQLQSNLPSLSLRPASQHILGASRLHPLLLSFFSALHLSPFILSRSPFIPCAELIHATVAITSLSGVLLAPRVLCSQLSCSLFP